MMTGFMKQLMMAASLAAGVSALSSVPAFGASLTNIEFNTTDFLTYNRDNGTLGDTAGAISALTDNDPVTNVELGAKSEINTANIGFSAKLGGKSVSVETVTAADWNIFGLQWAADFAKAYPTIASLGLNVLQMGGLPRSGDPNIGSFTQDDTTGEYKLDLIGHYNLLKVPHFITAVGGKQNVALLSGLLGGAPLQMSEIAKVTIDGAVHYAYSFAATHTGYTASDGFSHNGLYTWTLDGEPSVADVPEPSTMLGLMAVGGLFAAAKRKSAKNA